MIHTWRGLTDVEITSVFKLQEDLELTDLFLTSVTGICVRHEMSSAVHMHHKFALVDGKRLITGSLNWTLTAVQSNKENIMVTEEPELVGPYQQEFLKLWEANDPANHKPQCTNGQLNTYKDR